MFLMSQACRKIGPGLRASVNKRERSCFGKSAFLISDPDRQAFARQSSRRNEIFLYIRVIWGVCVNSLSTTYQKIFFLFYFYELHQLPIAKKPVIPRLFEVAEACSRLGPGSTNLLPFKKNRGRRLELGFVLQVFRRYTICSCADFFYTRHIALFAPAFPRTSSFLKQYR